jgi:hypothetical protein
MQELVHHRTDHTLLALSALDKALGPCLEEVVRMLAVWLEGMAWLKLYIFFIIYLACSELHLWQHYRLYVAIRELFLSTKLVAHKVQF